MIGTHHIITWLIIGLLAGALAGRVVTGRGFGCLANIVVGLAGAVVGGLLLHYFQPTTTYGLAGDVISDTVVSFIGAAILLALLMLLSGGHIRRRNR